MSPVPPPPWAASSVREPARDRRPEGDAAALRRPGPGHRDGGSGLAAALEEAGMPRAAIEPWLARCRHLAAAAVGPGQAAIPSGAPTWTDLQGELVRLDQEMRAEVLCTLVRRSLRRVRGSLAATLLEALLPLARGTDERLGAGLEVEASRPPMALAVEERPEVLPEVLPDSWALAAGQRGRLAHLRLAGALAVGLRPGFDSSLAAFELAFVGASPTGPPPAGLDELLRMTAGSAAGEVAARDQLGRLAVAVALWQGHLRGALDLLDRDPIGVSASATLASLRVALACRLEGAHDGERDGRPAPPVGTGDGDRADHRRIAALLLAVRSIPEREQR